MGKMVKGQRIGILTAGGDCPGINAAIGASFAAYFPTNFANGFTIFIATFLIFFAILIRYFPPGNFRKTFVSPRLIRRRTFRIFFFAHRRSRLKKPENPS